MKSSRTGAGGSAHVDRQSIRSPRRAAVAALQRVDRRQVLTFAAIGVVSTVAYTVLFAALRTSAGPVLANVIALAITMALNFWANRSFTFRATDGRLVSQAGQFTLAYLAGLALSTGVFEVLLVVFNPRGLVAQTAAGLASGVLATIVRYVLMSRWVFAPPRRFAEPELRGKPL